MGVRVKICGITALEDALTAIDAGADALGFVFCDASPRSLSPLNARKIIAELPPFITKVGLFVNAAEQIVRDTIRVCGIDVVQLHGEESPEFCQGLSAPIIKAFRIRDENSLAALPLYPVSAWLLDSYVAGKHGGTGECFNWELATRAVQISRPIVLAGGLTPENVADAVRQVHPYAVDVSSGVEFSPGRKDSRKVRDFIQAAKSVT